MMVTTSTLTENPARPVIRNSAPTAANNSDAAVQPVQKSQGEFENFENVAKKLVETPKPGEASS